MRYMITLSDEIVDMLDHVASVTGNTRSGVVHIAVLEFLERYAGFFGLKLSVGGECKDTNYDKAKNER